MIGAPVLHKALLAECGKITTKGQSQFLPLYLDVKEVAFSCRTKRLFGRFKVSRWSPCWKWVTCPDSTPPAGCLLVTHGRLHLQLPDWWRCTPQLLHTKALGRPQLIAAIRNHVRHLLRIVAHALTKLHFFLLNSTLGSHNEALMRRVTSVCTISHGHGLPVKYIVAAVVVPVLSNHVFERFSLGTEITKYGRFVTMRLFAPSPGGSLHALFRTVSNIIKDGLFASAESEQAICVCICGPSRYSWPA